MVIEAYRTYYTQIARRFVLSLAAEDMMMDDVIELVDGKEIRLY